MASPAGNEGAAYPFNEALPVVGLVSDASKPEAPAEEQMPTAAEAAGAAAVTTSVEVADEEPKARQTRKGKTTEFVWDEEALADARKSAEETPTFDGVRTYLRQIGRIKLLSAVEEVDLSKRIEAGLYAAHKLQEADKAEGQLATQLHRDLQWIKRDGERAKAELLEANLRLVVALAKRYTGRGLDFLDLIQEGNLGLVRAVEKFDYTKGFKFSTYATWWIRQAITRGLADQARTIRIPVHLLEVINKLGRIKRELLLDLGREPTSEELAIEAGVPLKKVLEIQQCTKEPISLDQETDTQSTAQLGDFIEDADAADPAEVAAMSSMQRELRNILATLESREAKIVRLRYGLDTGVPLTLAEIGNVLGVTRERIRQIEKHVMEKLRHPSRAGKLRDFHVEDESSS